jgi:hypothetical protein
MLSSTAVCTGPVICARIKQGGLRDIKDIPYGNAVAVLARSVEFNGESASSGIGPATNEGVLQGM